MDDVGRRDVPEGSSMGMSVFAMQTECVRKAVCP